MISACCSQATQCLRRHQPGSVCSFCCKGFVLLKTKRQNFLEFVSMGAWLKIFALIDRHASEESFVTEKNTRVFRFLLGVFSSI